MRDGKRTDFAPKKQPEKEKYNFKSEYSENGVMSVFEDLYTAFDKETRSDTKTLSKDKQALYLAAIAIREHIKYLVAPLYKIEQGAEGKLVFSPQFDEEVKKGFTEEEGKLFKQYNIILARCTDALKGPEELDLGYSQEEHNQNIKALAELSEELPGKSRILQGLSYALWTFAVIAVVVTIAAISSDVLLSQIGTLTPILISAATKIAGVLSMSASPVVGAAIMGFGSAATLTIGGAVADHYKKTGLAQSVGLFAHKAQPEKPETKSDLRQGEDSSLGGETPKKT